MVERIIAGDLHIIAGDLHPFPIFMSPSINLSVEGMRHWNVELSVSTPERSIEGVQVWSHLGTACP